MSAPIEVQPIDLRPGMRLADGSTVIARHMPRGNFPIREALVQTDNGGFRVNIVDTVTVVIPDPNVLRWERS